MTLAFLIAAAVLFVPSEAHALTALITAAATAIASALPAAGPLLLTGAGAGFGATIWAVAQTLATLGVIGGGVAASLIGRQTPSFNPGDAKNTFEEQETPEFIAVGLVEISGLAVFGNTNSTLRYRVIGHAKGLLDGIENYYLGGREVILDGDGLVVSPPYRISDEASYVHWDSKVGDGTETAWSELITKFPALWTSDHRVRGIAQSLIRYESPGFGSETFLKLYQNGVPGARIRGRFQLCYDPRIDDDKWTTNGILCALHVILLCYDKLSLEDFDLDFIGEEADRADALVETKNGNEPRSQCSGVWSSEQEKSRIVSDVLRSVGAMIVPRPDSKLGLMLLDDTRTEEVTLPAKHLLDIQWQSGPESVERPNICRLKYYSPERNFEMTEIDLTGIGWARIDDEVTRVGPQYFDIDLPFCTNAPQAQRIARQMFLLARADSGMATYNMVGLSVWEARTVAIEFPDDIGTMVCANGPPRVTPGRGEVEVPFAVWPELSAWDPDEDEADTPSVLPEFVSNVVATPPAPTAATVVEYPDTSRETRVAIDVAFSLTPEVVYRTYNGDGNPNPWRRMIPEPIPTPENYSYAYIDADLETELVDFRVRQYSGEESGAWSDIFQTTLAIDNSAPGDPSVIATYDNENDDVIIDVVAPTSLNVSYIDTDDVEVGMGGPYAPGVVQVRPRDTIQWTNTVPPQASFVGGSAQAFSSNDTGSNLVSDTIPTPDPE